MAREDLSTPGIELVDNYSTRSVKSSILRLMKLSLTSIQYPNQAR